MSLKKMKQQSLFSYYNLRDKELYEDVGDPEFNFFLCHVCGCEFGKVTSFPTTHLSSPPSQNRQKTYLGSSLLTNKKNQSWYLQTQPTQAQKQSSPAFMYYAANKIRKLLQFKNKQNTSSKRGFIQLSLQGLLF